MIPPAAHEAASSPESDDDELRARREHAVGLAESVADRARSIRPRSEALLLLINYADIVWDETPDRSRGSLLRVVKEAVNSSDLSAESLDAVSDEDRTRILARALTVAGRHDQALLDKLSRELSAYDEPSPGESSGDATRLAEVYRDLAELTLSSNPGRSAELLVRSIQLASVSGQVRLLTELENLDRSRAEAAFLAATESVVRSEPVDLNRVSELSSFLFSTSRTPLNSQVAGRNYVNVHGNVGRTPESEEAARRYLDLLLDAAMRARPTSPTDVYVVLSNYAGLYDRYRPDRREVVSQLLAVCRPSIGDEAARELDSSRLEAPLSGHAPESVEFAYARIASIGDVRLRDRETLRFLLDQAIGVTDAKVCRKIAGAISDGPGRRQVLDLIDFVEIAIRCEDDPKYLPDSLAIAKFGSPVLRAAAMTLAGEVALRQDDTALASSLLESASREAVRVAEPADRALLTLRIASAYSQRKLPQALELFRAAITDANRTDGFGVADINRGYVILELSWSDVAERTPLSLRGIGLAPTIDRMVAVDYWRTAELVSLFRSQTLRGLAELWVARSELRSASNRRNKPSSSAP